MLPFFLGSLRRVSSVACLLLSASLAGSALTAQTPQPPANSQAPASAPAPQPSPSIATAPPSAPTLRITTREVLFDVLAVDANGHPVTGLKAADFSISEEGQPQVIRRLDEHHGMSAADMEKLSSAPPLPPNTFSNFTPVRNTNASIVLLLDAMDSPVEAQMAMREQLIKYLKQMQPGPPVAIFQLDTEMHLIQGFTSDPKVLLAAAESKRDMPSLSRPTAAPRNYSGDAVYRRTLMEALRNGMRMMGSYLAGFPGRKNLIWFTGQVPMTVMGMGFGNPFRDGLAVRSTGDDLTDLTDVLTVSRIAVYPVDTRGLGMGPDIVGGRRGFPSPRSPFFDHNNMDLVAAQTGGKAYYNTNDFTKVITDVVNSTSSYYTIAYATTNSKWNGELRKIEVTVDRPDVQLQHKKGYYAYSLDKREQNGIESIEKRRAAQSPQQNASVQPAGDTQSAAQQPAGNVPPAEQTPGGAQDANPAANSDALGATVHHSANGGFDAAMALGAVPPTEIVFAARILPDTGAQKLEKDAPLPPDNYLKPEWQHKPFRNYTVVFDTDIHRVRVEQTPDGLRHGKVDFVAIVYTTDGQMVNSTEQKASFDITQDQYREMLVSGIRIKQQIAVPVKGNFFLRLGVHDETGDQVGALEVPVDQISLNTSVAQKDQ
jgi:VWFA-related protein